MKTSYEIIWELERRAPNSENLLPEDQPARAAEKMPVLPMAKMKSRPTFRLASCMW